MKNLFPKLFVVVIVSAVLFQIPLFAQVKINFTPEIRPTDSNPTGLTSSTYTTEHNKVDVKVPKKTRGVDRYDKLNIWGEKIPDSFLFFRNTLNQRQKAVYDVCYKALMKNEEDPYLPVEITLDELREVIHAIRYDNPEVFWWAGVYSYWDNSDGTPTRVRFHYWLDISELEQYYEKFWKATAPILFYASTLPDEMSKIKYIHDYICLSTEYDYDSLNAGNTGGKLQTPYSCAVEYKTVCAGYAALFQYYMQNLGIPCAKITSDTHAWNLLKVNGKFYQMDVTWNDTKQIPPYFNLTHEEMAKIDSHTPDEPTQKVINANPSKGNQMSYLQYFGALYEGSPYTYQELAYYDYEKNSSTQDTVKVYKNEPEILNIVKSGDELKGLLKKVNYTDGTVFTFFVPSENEYNEINKRLQDGDVCNWKKGSASYVGNSLIYNLTLAGTNVVKPEDSPVDDNSKIPNSQTKKVETSSSVYSVYVTLGGDSADNAKKVAESFSNVASVSVNNLEKGLFELAISVKGDSEIRPSLAKKFIQGGFDLFEMSITQNKDDTSSKNTNSQNTNNTESQNTNNTESQNTKKTESQAAKKTVKNPAPKIGDKGPGGGIVFYIDGKTAYECSELLGEADWEKAKTLCKNYRGGGKSDWYLPNRDQLNQVYQNLRKTGKINDEEWYWSSTPDGYNFADIQRFADGRQDYDGIHSTLSVRAVRAFEY